MLEQKDQGLDQRPILGSPGRSLQALLGRLWVLPWGTVVVVLRVMSSTIEDVGGRVAVVVEPQANRP